MLISVLIMAQAIFISLVFPFAAPLIFNLLDFRKVDWPVSINLKRLKNPAEYDVIIAGAGASVFPGAGVEAVVMSGTLCANDICAWKIR